MGILQRVAAKSDFLMEMKSLHQFLQLHNGWSQPGDTIILSSYGEAQSLLPEVPVHARGHRAIAKAHLQGRRAQCQRRWPRLPPVLDPGSPFLLYEFLQAFLWE